MKMGKETTVKITNLHSVRDTQEANKLQEKVAPSTCKNCNVL